MYAIIRTGGKQQKVHEGDVLDVERLKGTQTAQFTPVLLVGDDGSVITDKDALAKASVTVEVVGEHRGNKIEGFTYKNKTGNRRRHGHRQTYTTIKVTKIEAEPKKTAKKKAAQAESKPKADKAESKADKAEPKADKAEPKADKAEPKADKAESKAAAADEPKTAKTEPKADKAEPKADEAKTEPKAAKAEPKAAAADEPKKDTKPAAEAPAAEEA